VVGDGDTVGITGEVGEDVPCILERLFRVDYPLLGMQSREEPLPGWGLGECPTAPRPGELPLAIELLQPRQIQPSKTPREDADGQEEVRPTWDPTRAI